MNTHFKPLLSHRSSHRSGIVGLEVRSHVLPGRAPVLVCAALLSLAVAGQASALELQVGFGSRAVSDPSFGYVSDEASLGSLELMARGALPLGSHLSWSAGYAFSQSRSEAYPYSTYYYDEAQPIDPGYVPSYYQDDLSSALQTHTLQAGVMLEIPVNKWLFPYLRLNAQGVLARISFEDGLTGWSMPDPEDPTGETSLYTVPGFSELGFAGGVQAGLGLALRFPFARLSTQDAAAAAPGAGASSSSPTPAGQAAGEYGWGVNVEGRYALQSPLKFQNAGSLQLSGVEIQAGLSFWF